MRSGGSRSYQTSVIDGQAEPSVRSFAPILCAGHMAKRLAIVGAGAAGLLAARKFFEYGGFEISVFEQSENIGGTWVYSSDTNVHSSLYEKMTTNLPKEVMYYPGSPFRQETNGESFVPHQVVRQYLEDYAKNIRHLIKFNHTVLKVERIDEKWSVTTQASSEHPKIEVFDVVFVCSGHYTDPSYPLTKHEFSGRSLHSHNYRRAEYYKGQTVAVIGAGNSGMDISLQVSAEAEKVYLLHSHAPKYSVLPKNIEERKSLADFGDDGNQLLLTDGSTIDRVDTVIFCTGYYYSFPFLDESIVHMTNRGTVVEPLVLHMVHKDFPTSLFFFGIPFNLVPFMLFDYQARFALSLINGTGVLDEEEIEKFEVKRSEGLVEKFGRKKECHYIGKAQWDLLKTYAKLGHFEYDTPQKVADMYIHTVKQRAANVVTYKKMKFGEDGENMVVFE